MVPWTPVGNKGSWGKGGDGPYLVGQMKGQPFSQNPIMRASNVWGPPQRANMQWMPPVMKPWLKQNQNGPWSPGPSRKPPPTVPATFQVDSNARYAGTVDFYQKWKGYGFLKITQPGVVPNDRIFVHWKQVMSDDRFPFLSKDIEVELSIMKQRDNWNPNIFTLRANNVTQVGGTNVALQDEIDASTKTFVGGQHLRYTGTLKFFNARRGMGYVMMDPGYDVDASVPQELRVHTEEVNAGGRQALTMENLAVEFGIFKTPRGLYQVYNMTLPGGHPLTQDALENRISMGVQGYKGEITMWNWRAGWGFIRADAAPPLPPRVLAKLQAQVAAARQRGKNINEDKLLYFRKNDCNPTFQGRKGSQVTFQIYIDDKGAGACEVLETTL